jgi:hypothetical protein
MLAVIPFHLGYHFYNGISFVLGMIRFSRTRRRKARHYKTRGSATRRIRRMIGSYRVLSFSFK